VCLCGGGVLPVLPLAEAVQRPVRVVADRQVLLGDIGKITDLFVFMATIMSNECKQLLLFLFKRMSICFDWNILQGIFSLVEVEALGLVCGKITHIPNPKVKENFGTNMHDFKECFRVGKANKGLYNKR